MAKHRILITETLSRIVEIEADNVDVALETIEDMYWGDEIQLSTSVVDGTNYVATDFYPVD